MQKLEINLGYTFKDKKLLRQALTHKSFNQKNSNERLEFLGDAVLDLIVGQHLFFAFPGSKEGDLSRLRAALVNEKSFAKIANFLDLGKFLLISMGEDANKGRSKPSLLSNAFEAVMGAIYLESGLKKASSVFEKLLKSCFDEISLESLGKDYKTAFQELTQSQFGITPEYKIISTFGPDHNKSFEMSVFVNNKLIAKGVGRSKKEGEQEAAKIALEKFRQEEGLI